jgi:hypothetical protein
MEHLTISVPSKINVQKKKGHFSKFLKKHNVIVYIFLTIFTLNT